MSDLPVTSREHALVSVVIPTFNRCDLLIRAIVSVRNQTYPHWELIVVDDGSTDNTAATVEAIDDPRIRLIVNPERRGAGFSRGVGAGEARGDFVAFLDSDDYWLAIKLDRQLRAVREAALDRVVVFGPMMVGVGGRPVQGMSHPYHPDRPIVEFIYSGRGFPLQSSGLLLSSDIAKEIRFDPTLRVNQDSDYLIRLDRAGANFIYLPEALHVQDAMPRLDRISTDTSLVADSMAWFERQSYDWSEKARCGYFLNDASIRVARSGQRLLGLKYFVRGWCPDAGPYYLARQFVRVLGGGEVPSGFSAFWKVMRRRRPQPIASSQPALISEPAKKDD